jgi:DinB family protein
VTGSEAQALLDRIDAAWRPFRDAIVAARGRFDERTVSGWSLGEMVAHVAAWEDLTARRLRAFREAGERTYPEDALDTDAFNARVAAAHRSTPPDALFAEVDDAHTRLVAEIAKLSDEQMRSDVQPTAWGPQSWVVAVVAGNTFGHYREHASEVGLR